MKKIAIQGTLGSYHDIAAHKYFEGEEIELICCANFEDGLLRYGKTARLSEC